MLEHNYKYSLRHKSYISKQIVHLRVCNYILHDISSSYILCIRLWQIRRSESGRKRMKGGEMCVSFSCGQHGLDYFTGSIRAVSKLGSLTQSDFVSNIPARLL